MHFLKKIPVSYTQKMQGLRRPQPMLPQPGLLYWLPVQCMSEQIPATAHLLQGHTLCAWSCLRHHIQRTENQVL